MPDEVVPTSDELVTTAHRLERLQHATAALAQARTSAEVVTVAVRLGAEAVGAASSMLWGATSEGTISLMGSHNVPGWYVDEWRSVAAAKTGPFQRVVERSEALWIENEVDFAREAPEMFERARAVNRVWSFAALPLVRHHRTSAVVAYSFEGPHVFSERERQFLQALAQTCEQALDRARLYETEAEARRIADAMNRRKDEYLAMLGHELRNPLAAISSAMDFIKLRDGSLNRELAIVDRQLGHLIRIVDDLLNVTRVTQGKIELEREAVNLAEAAEQAIETSRPSIAAHSHDVTLDIDADLIVDADRHRLVQVLSNLVTNAAKYTPDRGAIVVAATETDDWVEIVVRDNGRGIEAALLPHIFEPFVQGPRMLARREGGLGIGLTLVRGLVELHGGTIRARSYGPGTGSSFIIRWPRASSRTKTAAMIPLERPVVITALRVLIVDDEPDIAELLVEMIRLLGHSVMVAHDALAALDVAAQSAPDVAMLDIGLPAIDGHELGRRLRRMYEHTVLIAVTGRGGPEDREQSSQAGFAHHLVKPVDLKTVAAVLPTVAKPMIPR